LVITGISSVLSSKPNTQTGRTLPIATHPFSSKGALPLGPTGWLSFPWPTNKVPRPLLSRRSSKAG